MWDFNVFVFSVAGGLHGGLWSRTGRTRSRWRLLAHLYCSARMGASKAARVLGLSSRDPDGAAGEKQPQCERPCREIQTGIEFFFGPVRLNSTPCDVLQGEALETVCTAAVCLFSSQSQLADQVPPLGHLPRVLAALNHKNNAVPKSAIRLIHVLSDNEVSSQSLTHTQSPEGTRLHVF